MLAQVKTYSPWDVACICVLKPLPVCWCSPPIHRDSIKHFGLGMPLLSLNLFFFGACFGVSFCFTMLKKSLLNKRFWKIWVSFEQIQGFCKYFPCVHGRGEGYIFFHFLKPSKYTEKLWQFTSKYCFRVLALWGTGSNVPSMSLLKYSYTNALFLMTQDSVTW